MVFWDARAGVCFAGDLVFQGSIGRTDLPGCDVGDMRASLRLLLDTLPGGDKNEGGDGVADECALFCGHMDQTTIADERRSNPFLRAELEGQLASLL